MTLLELTIKVIELYQDKANHQLQVIIDTGEDRPPIKVYEINVKDDMIVIT